MHRARMLSLALVLVAALAACSSGSKAPHTTTTTTDSQLRIVTIVGSYVPKLRSEGADAKRFVAAWNAGCVKDCVALARSLDALKETSSGIATQLVITEPPADLVPLVRSTITAATDISNTIRAIAEAGGCTSAERNPLCETSTKKLASEVDAMTAVLDRWKPYGI